MYKKYIKYKTIQREQKNVNFTTNTKCTKSNIVIFSSKSTKYNNNKKQQNAKGQNFFFKCIATKKVLKTKNTKTNFK